MKYTYSKMDFEAYIDDFSFIGNGSEGSVYRIDEDNAIKILKKPDQITLETQKTIYDELSKEEICYIIPSYDVLYINDSFGLTMKFFPYNLETLINEGISIRDALHIAKHILCGLYQLYSHGYIWLDCNPRNILMGDNMIPQFTDIGNASKVDNSNELQDIDKNKTICTPLYAAPEVILYYKASYKSDIFSWGVLLYQLLTQKYALLSEEFYDSESNDYITEYLKFQVNVDCAEFQCLDELTKSVILGCLSMNPYERMSFSDIFGSGIFEKYI